jgi:tetratricopeptide (TPR) repeat protein
MRPFLFLLVFVTAALAESLEQLVNAGRLVEAREELQQILKTSGPSNRTRFIEAMILYKEGKFLESMRLLRDLLGPEQRDAGVYKLFGLNLVAAEREADAEPFFRAAAQLAPEDSSALYYLGMATLSLKQYDEAERILRDVVRRQPQDVAAHTMLGLAYEQLRKTALAVESYQTAARLAREQGESALQPDLYLSRYLLGQSRFGEAAAVLKVLVTEVPDHAEAHRLLGRAFNELGEVEKALLHLQRATALAPADRQARYALARTLQRLGKQAEAEREYRILRQDDNNDPRPRR